MGASHPFAATVEKINAFSPYFQLSVGAPPDESWLRADRLLSDPDRLTATIRGQHLKRSYLTLRDVAISYFDCYQWYVGAAAISAFLADERVPDVGAENVALKFDADGWVAGIALIDAHFTCLPDDPAATHLDARVLSDRDALREYAARSIYTHVSQLAAPLRKAAGGISEQSLRLASANSQSGLVLSILQEAGQPVLAEAEAHAFALALPFPAKARLFEVECDGERKVFVNGSVCCHWYLEPENPDKSYCNNCPKVPLSKRIERLRTRMREAHREKLNEAA